MKYVIIITSNDEVEIVEYVDYETINALVGGSYETCGVFGVLDTMVILFCNEEFLLRDELEFNAVGTALANQPIYGNVVLLKHGRNENDEPDSFPFTEVYAVKVREAIERFRDEADSILFVLKANYSKNKPKPKAEIITLSAEEFSEVLGDETNNSET